MAFDLLIDRGTQNGENDAVAKFAFALEEEMEHLASVRGWIAAAQNRPGE